MKSSVKVSVALALVGFVIWLMSVHFKEYVELMFRIVAMLFMIISLLIVIHESEVQ
jgi:hypothetical protein